MWIRIIEYETKDKDWKSKWNNMITYMREQIYDRKRPKYGIRDKIEEKKSLLITKQCHVRKRYGRAEHGSFY